MFGPAARLAGPYDGSTQSSGGRNSRRSRGQFALRMTRMTQPTSDQRRPFLSAPNPKRYFAAGAIEEARQRIVRTIARSEGPALLIGAAGTGKSLLLAVLAEQFAPRLHVATVAGAQACTRRALLQTILAELGLPYRGMDEGELRLSLSQYLLRG